MSQWHIMQGVEVAGDPAALLVAQSLAQAQPAGDPQHHQRIADGTARGLLAFRLVREPALQFVVGGEDAAAVVAGVQAQQLPRELVARGEVARQQQAPTLVDALDRESLARGRRITKAIAAEVLSPEGES